MLCSFSFFLFCRGGVKVRVSRVRVRGRGRGRVKAVIDRYVM